MSSQPPFDITPEIVDLIAQISETVGYVKRDLKQSSPQLRKQNRIKTITGTLAIEGNTLSEEQVSAVLEGKKVFATKKELAEVKGAVAAYDQLHTFSPDSLDDLLHSYKLMMAAVLDDAGELRTKPVGIYKDQKIIHVAPQANRVMILMTNLLAWQKSSQHHPLIVSSVFHYELEYIHPFMDGNGRLGRLWQTLILSKWQPMFLDLPLESVIKQHQQDYYAALRQSDKASNSTAFIEFMLHAILATLHQNESENATLNATVNATLNSEINLDSLKTPEAIIALIQQNPKITRKEMAERIGKNLSTIARAIKKLRQQNKLKRIGSDKSGRWQVL
jgi:Uncharacterized conserved protein